MEGKTENAALLDKAVFNNIRIRGFTNFEELQKCGVVEVHEKSSADYITESGQEFSRLQIKGDSPIGQMVAASRIIGNKRIDYCTLSTTISGDDGTNLNCYTVGQYIEHTHQIQDKLMCEYGIDTDFSGVSLKEIEINKTFCLDGDFQEYHRPLVLIMSNLPGVFKGQMEFMDKDGKLRETNTYYARTCKSRKSKRYLLFKIYDKSKSVEKTITLTESYMRVEIRLIGAEKIKSSLGTTKLVELTDEAVNGYFNSQMDSMVIKPYAKWKEGRDKHVLEIMQEQQKQDVKHWIVNTLRILQNEEVKKRCPILLDVSELMPLVDQMYTEDRMVRYQAKCRFRKQAQKFETAFCQKDDKKLLEVMEKMKS